MRVGEGFQRIAEEHGGVVDQRVDIAQRRDQPRYAVQILQVIIHPFANNFPAKLLVQREYTPVSALESPRRFPADSPPRACD